LHKQNEVKIQRQMKFLDLINESRFEQGQGSIEGRAGFVSGQNSEKEKLRSTKGRVRVFASIAKALAALDYGQVFSTVASNRLYVVTKPTWGEKSRQNGNKVAKGFSAGTPFSEIRGYAERTMKKHAEKRDDEQ
jgi:hypothetical protein